MCKLLFVIPFLVWFLFVVVVAMCTLVRVCLTFKKPKFQKQLREGEKILETVEKEQSSQASERESRCSDSEEQEQSETEPEETIPQWHLTPTTPCPLVYNPDHHSF